MTVAELLHIADENTFIYVNLNCDGTIIKGGGFPLKAFPREKYKNNMIISLKTSADEKANSITITLLGSLKMIAAVKLDKAMKLADPYGYRDSEMCFEQALECIQDRPLDVIDYLSDTIINLCE